MGNIAVTLAIVCGLPAIALSLFLTYLTLKHINATELMWFVFIIYVPAIVIGMIASKLADVD